MLLVLCNPLHEQLQFSLTTTIIFDARDASGKDLCAVKTAGTRCRNDLPLLQESFVLGMMNAEKKTPRRQFVALGAGSDRLLS